MTVLLFLARIYESKFQDKISFFNFSIQEESKLIQKDNKIFRDTRMKNFYKPKDIKSVDSRRKKGLSPSSTNCKTIQNSEFGLSPCSSNSKIIQNSGELGLSSCLSKTGLNMSTADIGQINPDYNNKNTKEKEIKKGYNFFYFVGMRNIYVNLFFYKSAFTTKFKFFSKITFFILLELTSVTLLCTFIEMDLTINNIFKTESKQIKLLAQFIFTSVLVSNIVFVLFGLLYNTSSSQKKEIVSSLTNNCSKTDNNNLL
jgi:hypothetical protein